MSDNSSLSTSTNTSTSTSTNTSTSTSTSTNTSASASAGGDLEVINYLKQEKCIVEGEFKLKNGEISNVYYDIKGIISNPELFRLVCDNLICKLPNNLINYSLIYGIPYGGLPIASYLAITNNKGLIYSRNKKKEYGTKKLIEGRYREEQRVIIVDDVITTGGSLKESIILARDTLKLRVIACLVVVNRNNIETIEDVPIFSLVNACT
jgi:orotate phosphoribosyltransferase